MALAANVLLPSDKVERIKMTKALVFISCGQRNDEEKSYGKAIMKHFEGRGFNPYFAAEIHDYEGLTENIFKALRNSEYFVSVNFKRKDNSCGSLFVQQELAIAAFLKIPMVPLRVGTIKLQGIAEHLIINEKEIGSPKEALRYLTNKTKKWVAETKNRFELSFENHHFNVKTTVTKPNGKKEERIYDWYHIKVENKSTFKTAYLCVGYLEYIRKLSGTYLHLPTDYLHELNWAGYNVVQTNILRKGKRDLDAFFHDKQADKIAFAIHSVSSAYRYPELNYGTYVLCYVIMAENMSDARIKITIHFDGSGIKVLKVAQIYEETQERGT